MESNQLPEIRWYEGDCEHRAGWRSEAGIAPHADIRLADDRTGADDAYRLLESGTALLWRGDWVNVRHLIDRNDANVNITVTLDGATEPMHAKQPVR